MNRSPEWQAKFEALMELYDAVEDLGPYLDIERERVCMDCLHTEPEHSIPDPNQELAYGMGSCGNCTVCQLKKWRTDD